ncbi:MAG TPA: hypothetical protein VL793_11350 [Patescibacteria group bacterium]|jgi:hypothetical protein|nr:hypothetical protein [Patescibacteria group bacterium]
MDDDTFTFHPGEATCEPRSRVSDLGNQTDDKMINHAAPRMALPCRAGRQKIMEQANLVLAEARLVAEESDRTMALLSAESSV